MSTLGDDALVTAIDASVLDSVQKLLGACIMKCELSHDAHVSNNGLVYSGQPGSRTRANGHRFRQCTKQLYSTHYARS